MIAGVVDVVVEDGFSDVEHVAPESWCCDALNAKNASNSEPLRVTVCLADAAFRRCAFLRSASSRSPSNRIAAQKSVCSFTSSSALSSLSSESSQIFSLGIGMLSEVDMR